MTEIIDQDQNKENKDTDAETDDEENSSTITLNKIPIGKTFVPYEVEAEDSKSPFEHPSNQDSLNILNMDPRVDINATNKNGLP